MLASVKNADAKFLKVYGQSLIKETGITLNDQ